MILKKGAKGHYVSSLQEALGIDIDGIFGTQTELAVRAYQKEQGLIQDGIVGPKTWDMLGIASTDVFEMQYAADSQPRIIKHYLPKGEYKEGPTSKEFLFLHHTAGWHNPYKTIDDWASDDRGTIATEFVLGGPSCKGDDNTYDGTLLQCVPEGGYGWHLGPNGSQYMHTHSVGIEVCSFGQLTEKNGEFYTWANTKVDKSQVVKLNKEFRGFQYWHRYSNNQISVLREFILFIANRDKIDVRKGLISEVKSKGPYEAFEFNQDAYSGKVKGMWTHTNTRKDKFDLFPQEELVHMLLSL